jgi:serine/threonine protein kinase
MLTSRISDYEVGRVLGVGTVGTIYEATSHDGADRYAIKKLHPGVADDALIRARFRREMLVLERLHHPHIVRYYGGGDDDGQLFYVMELVDGGTVKDLLSSHDRLAWPMVVEIARQVCSALQCAHNNGVVHRDLKPGNLFLNREAEVKLGDFGIARDLQGSDITVSGMTVGTHAYMPPEQITGEASVSGKADLYSLGCCLFEMLVGRTPFVAENFAHLFEQHLRAEPPRVREFVPACPAELDEIVYQLLAKNPRDRPFNARQVQGVMLRLDSSRSESEPDSTEDVAAANVSARGHVMLIEQIEQQFNRGSEADVSWGKLAFIVAAIAAIVAAARVFGT